MKNPRAAAVLSAIFPGLGQFYNRHWLKGGGFLAAAVILSGLANDQFSIESLVAGDTSGLSKVQGLLLIFLAVQIWSMVDAYRSAKTSLPKG
jgi:TM2 domain-containing membrane protein YozV